MAKISVVVPVYNVEKYIHKCLDSILSQTMEDMEIILVDDGATDNSGQICDEYQKKDARIKVIHKTNGGLSDARNAGTKEATGEYIIYIDSDDYIKETMIEKLYGLMTKYNPDVAVCGVYNVYANGQKPQCDVLEEFECSNVEAFAHLMVGQKIPGGIWNKMIKREIAEKIDFPVGKLYEDAFYSTILMQKVKRVAVTTEPMYYYFHRKGSITTSPFKKRDMDIIEAYQKNMEVIKEKFPEIEEKAKFRLDWAYFAVLDRILQLDDYRKCEQYPEVVRYLKKNTMSVLKSKYFYKSRKVGAAALFVNVRIYRMLVQYNNKKIPVCYRGDEF